MLFRIIHARESGLFQKWFTTAMMRYPTNEKQRHMRQDKTSENILYSNPTSASGNRKNQAAVQPLSVNCLRSIFYFYIFSLIFSAAVALMECLSRKSITNANSIFQQSLL